MNENIHAFSAFYVHLTLLLSLSRRLSFSCESLAHLMVNHVALLALGVHISLIYRDYSIIG